ncbi:putative FAD-linked oxidoreductase, partial [Lachnellula suecica]
GISYFSGQYGWGCDNVRNYEVVLSNSSIVNASPTSNPDLYWALRGGTGVNFGLVSRFDLFTFEQGDMFGGSKIYSMVQNASLSEAYSKFIDDAPTDEKAHLYLVFIYEAELGGFAAGTGPVYSEPIADPPIFAQLNSIPSLMDFTGVNSMGALAVALNQTTYSRETFKTVTFKNDVNLIKAIIEIWVEEVSTVLDIPGLLPACAFQPLSLPVLESMQKNGGNALGLSPTDGARTIMNLNFGWTNAADDTRVFDTVNRFVSRSVDLAKSMGLDDRFIYVNYASKDQDVFAGYGPESEARLKEVQYRYDTSAMFKMLQPGYFKL